MKLIINGIHANLRFSSAHMIPDHESCGFLHGHSYIVDVEIEGERSGEFGFVMDFKVVKNIVRDLCAKLDHRTILPTENPKLKIKSIENSVDFTVSNKEYKLPVEDCVLLSIRHTSAEELAILFAENLTNKILENGGALNSVTVCVNEGIGQGASYTKTI